MSSFTHQCVVGKAIFLVILRASPEGSLPGSA